MPTMLEDPTRPAPDATSQEPAAAEPPAPGRPAEVTVRVVADGGDPRRRRRPSIGGILTTVVAAAVAVAIFLVIGVMAGFLHLGNPFATTTIDRSPPALLKQLDNLSRYTAAEGHFEQTIDVQDKVSFLPAFVAGEHTVFLAQGRVDANVDFSGLAADAVQVRGDKAVTITLPQPTLGEATVDPAASHVASEDRGFANRVAGFFSDNPNGAQRFYKLAQQKIDAAARESNLVVRAETNTTKMLQGLLAKLGFADVQVSYTKPAPAPTR